MEIGRGCLVSMETGLWAGWLGSIPSRVGQGQDFSLCHPIQTDCRAHPAPLRGSRGWGVKQPEHEADHSPPCSAEVQNAWSYTTTPPIHLYGVVLSQAEGQLYLYLYFAQVSSHISCITV
jgi:hypothetical protein